MRKPDFLQLENQLKEQPALPVADWNPTLSGCMDLRIDRNGDWYHEGGIIRREGLVRLFARILRLEADGHYYLVTPVEKWRISVTDVPFIAISMTIEHAGIAANQILSFQTNVGDTVRIGANHPLLVEYAHPDAEPAPYITVRADLRARINRAVFVELAEFAIIEPVNNHPHYGVYSQGLFFSLGRTE